MSDADGGFTGQTAAQMLAFARKLSEGARHLRAVDAGRGGCTPCEEILRIGPTRLLAYTPERPAPSAPPLLVVYALVNRPYMLDLEPGRSFLQGLLAGGRPVYLVDWGYPGESERERSLEDYVVRDLDACAEAVQARHGIAQLDLLGVCQGGTMSLCHAALRRERVRRLVLAVTPVDFHAEDFLLAKWLRHVDVEAMVQRLGNIPGSLLNWAFMALKPLSLSSLKALDFLDIMDSPEALATFARMEHWIQDSPDQAGRAFAEFVAAFFRDNALLEGGLTLEGKPVTVSTLRCPVLNVYAEADHIVPPSSSRALAGLLPAQLYAERSFPGGHIGVFAGRRSASKAPHAINEWLDRTAGPA